MRSNIAQDLLIFFLYFFAASEASSYFIVCGVCSPAKTHTIKGMSRFAQQKKGKMKREKLA
jgi:hypothetical protein